MVDLFRYRKWDLVTHRGIYYLLSALIVAVCLYGLFAHGLRYGIDFKGGGLVTYQVQGTIPDSAKVIDDLRAALNTGGIKSAEVQVSPGSTRDAGDQIIIRTVLSEEKDADNDAILAGQITNTITPAVQNVLKTSMPGVEAPEKPIQEEVVTGTVSGDLIKKGVTAVVLGSLLILGWIALRYNIGGFGARYATAGIIALLHDLLTLVGMFALFRNVLEVNSPFIAALLTVLGYSIHDTIVIFDRIRENIRMHKGRTFAETVNMSLLETMARSVNTVLTVLFTLLALFFFGGPTLRDFTAAMLIGVIAGAYSSIFIASQLLVSWSKGKDREILPAHMDVKTAAPVAAVPQPATAGGAISAPVAPVTASVAPAKPAAEAVQRARQAGKTAKRRR